MLRPVKRWAAVLLVLVACSHPTTSVIVSKVDIPARTDLNPLIQEGDFVTVQVPNEELLGDDVVRYTKELQNQTTRLPIRANEQIRFTQLDTG